MSRYFAVGNTLTVIKMKMNRGLSLREAMADLCEDVPAAPRRAADIRKWVSKL